MFKRKTLQKAIDNFQSKIDQRAEKIDNKIKALVLETENIMNQINELMKRLVNYELVDDESGHDDINKQIESLRVKYDNALSKVRLYKEACDDTDFIKDDIPNIISIAKKQMIERKKEAGLNREKRDKFKQGLDRISKQIEQLDRDHDNMTGLVEAKQLRPLMKYIESRKVKALFEKYYLQALLNESSQDYIEQYIEPEAQSRNAENLCITVERHLSNAEVDKVHKINDLSLASYK